MLDLVDLTAFVRIADLRSISAAARALKAPKSSVSRSLGRLECVLEAALVERSTRNLRLTDAGVLFLPHARRILNDVEEAETAIGSFAGAPRGTLRVSATFSFAQWIIAPMLPVFMARYAEVRVILDVDNRNIDLLAQETDLVIRLGPMVDSALIARRLAVFEMFLCASPSYLARRGTPVSPVDLAQHELIGREDRPVDWAFTAINGRRESVADVAPNAVVPDPVGLLAVLTGGAGIGRLPDYLAAGAIRRGELVRVLPDMRSDVVEAHAVYPSHRSLSAKVRVFIDALVTHLNERLIAGD